MQFSIAITTCNRPERLAQGLEALVAQNYAGQDFEVIVADNGQPEGTRAVADAFSDRITNFHYLHDPRPGQMVGWHRSLAMASGEITCFIDDDALPDPTWLAALAEVYQDPGVGMATGPIRPQYESDPPDWVAEMTLGEPEAETMPLFGLITFGDAKRDIPSNFVWGTNFTIRKDCLIAAGGFHPGAMPGHLLRFYGDAEIAVGRAVANAGHQIIYHPEASVRHIIPVYRFSEAAVRAKFFTGGCARSFQTLRQVREAYEAPTTEALDEVAIRYMRRGQDATQALRDLVRDGLRAGIEAHLSTFVADVDFQRWVLRESYLDLDLCYDHPDLVAVAQPGGADWRSGTERPA